MTTPDETNPTQPAIEVAMSADPKSWHGPVADLRASDSRHDARLTTLESGFVRLEQKTDAQTAILGEIKGLLQNPKARWILLALAAAAYVWAKKSGVPIPFLE